MRAQAIALGRLKAKLVVLAEERQLAEVAELRGDAIKAEWGQQVSPGPRFPHLPPPQIVIVGLKVLCKTSSCLYHSKRVHVQLHLQISFP